MDDIKKNIQLERHINYVVSEIINEISNVQTILLCGSYGRNEGAWITDDHQQYLPYNDYDFIVITDEPCISKEDIDKLRVRCAQEIGIHWVDIDIYSSKKIKNLKAIQKNIDIIYGNKVVYGKPIEWSKKNILPNRLSYRDINTLYFTRLWTFWGTYNLIEKKDMSCDEIIFFKYQMSKAIFACIDMILIKNKLYCCSYNDKVKQIKELENLKHYYDMYDWALKVKVKPAETPLYNDDIKKIFYDVLNLYYFSAKESIGKKFRFYKNKNQFPIFYSLLPRNILIYLYRLLKKQSKYNAKYRKVMILQNSLFIDICENQIDIDYYSQKIEDIEKKISNVKTLEEIINKVAFLRNSL